MPEPTIIDRTNYRELGVVAGDVVLNYKGEAVGTVCRVWGDTNTPCRITIDQEHGGEHTPLLHYDKLIMRGWRFCRIQAPMMPPTRAPFSLHPQDHLSKGPC